MLDLVRGLALARLAAKSGSLGAGAGRTATGIRAAAGLCPGTERSRNGLREVQHRRARIRGNQGLAREDVLARGRLKASVQGRLNGTRTDCRQFPCGRVLPVNFAICRHSVSFQVHDKLSFLILAAHQDHGSVREFLRSAPAFDKGTSVVFQVGRLGRGDGRAVHNNVLECGVVVGHIGHLRHHVRLEALANRRSDGDGQVQRRHLVDFLVRPYLRQERQKLHEYHLIRVWHHVTQLHQVYVLLLLGNIEADNMQHGLVERPRAQRLLHLPHKHLENTTAGLHVIVPTQGERFVVVNLLPRLIKTRCTRRQPKNTLMLETILSYVLNGLVYHGRVIPFPIEFRFATDGQQVGTKYARLLLLFYLPPLTPHRLAAGAARLEVRLLLGFEAVQVR
mmetsp:Transcript_10811/g.30382  ORF Transcript_10811/g.30382 Transcript_10811/m.30382 type:complete len:393 (-) Transcript_10811:467-1645(-)